jgi:hypothetical protein
MSLWLPADAITGNLSSRPSLIFRMSDDKANYAYSLFYSCRIVYNIFCVDLHLVVL